ncbi:MAG: diguanylate cyclase [Allorhizobium sp.]
MKLARIKKITTAALLLPFPVIAILAVLLAQAYYDKYVMLEAGQQRTMLVSRAADLASSIIPAEADAAIGYLRNPGEDSGEILRQARLRVDRERAEVDSLLAADPLPGVADKIKDLGLRFDRLALYRAEMDQKIVAITSSIEAYQPLSLLYLDLVDLISGELGDISALRALRPPGVLLRANEAGLVVRFFGGQYLAGIPPTGEARLRFIEAAVVERTLQERLANIERSAAVTAVLDFERTPDGLWLRQTTEGMLRATVAPSSALLDRWLALQSTRTLLWRDSIAKALAEIAENRDVLAQRAEGQLIVLVSVIAALTILSGIFSILAAKGIALVDRLMREREDMLAHLSAAAHIDPLTGLYNRRGFEDGLARLLRQPHTGNRFTSIVIFDLDLFKRVNDDYGHDAGDIVLQQVAEIARAGFRSVDLLVRHGGEEFLALLPGTTVAEAAEIAERIRRAIETAEIGLPDGSTLHVSASFGCAGMPLQERYDDLNGLIKRADMALYAAKHTGRNRVASDEDASPVIDERRHARKA